VWSVVTALAVAALVLVLILRRRLPELRKTLDAGRPNRATYGATIWMSFLILFVTRQRRELFAAGDYKTKRWRSPVPESEEFRMHEFFPSVNYPTLADRFLNYAAERGRMGCPSGN
jgi:hypothetical protein